MRKTKNRCPGLQEGRGGAEGWGIHFQSSQNVHSPRRSTKASLPSRFPLTSWGIPTQGLAFTNHDITGTKINWWVIQMLKFVNKKQTGWAMGVPFGHDFRNRYGYGQLLRDLWGNRGNVDAVMLGLTFKKTRGANVFIGRTIKAVCAHPPTWHRFNWYPVLFKCQAWFLPSHRRDQFLLQRQKVTLKLPPLLVHRSCAKVGVTHVNRLLIINPK